MMSGADLRILRGGGGVLGRNSSRGGGVFRVQVRRNFHILTSKTKKTPRGGLNPLPPPPATGCEVWIMFHTADFIIHVSGLCIHLIRDTNGKS